MKTIFLPLRPTSVSQNSLNERNVESKEDNYRRDSFDDRFCDDLSEVLLEFLPIKAKLCLKNVSKQVQRTVFQRQYELYIDIIPEKNKIYSKIKHKFSSNKRVYKYYNVEDQSLYSIKFLLKNCPNITSIHINGPNLGSGDYDSVKVNKVFQLIIENCNHLSEIGVFKHILLNERILEEFHQKFGPKIKIPVIL